MRFVGVARRHKRWISTEKHCGPVEDHEKKRFRAVSDLGILGKQCDITCVRLLDFSNATPRDATIA